MIFDSWLSSAGKTNQTLVFHFWSSAIIILVMTLMTYCGLNVLNRHYFSQHYQDDHDYAQTSA